MQSNKNKLIALFIGILLAVFCFILSTGNIMLRNESIPDGRDVYIIDKEGTSTLTPEKSGTVVSIEEETLGFFAPVEDIRVLISNSYYKDIRHEKIVFISDSDIEITSHTNESNNISDYIIAGKEWSISSDSPYFENSDKILITPLNSGAVTTFLSINRALGNPAYSGCFEVQKCDPGLVLINELPIEEYLRGVVPSEMPASYPQEALKAQSICARTYALNAFYHPAYPDYGAHLDDSVSSQVYNNSKESEAVNEAISATFGVSLYYGNAPALTYYYSTSCGYGAGAGVWSGDPADDLPYLTPKHIANVFSDLDKQISHLSDSSELSAMLSGINENDFDYQESWYRWQATVPVVEPQKILQKVKDRYEKTSGAIASYDSSGKESVVWPKTITYIKSITVNSRTKTGAATSVIITHNKGKIIITGEYNIRYCLCAESIQLVNQDGGVVWPGQLLPSSFFVILPVNDASGRLVSYSLMGGGYGHGVGMSQNAAKNMANAGYSCEEILDFFYEGTYLKDIDYK